MSWVALVQSRWMAALTAATAAPHTAVGLMGCPARERRARSCHTPWRYASRRCCQRCRSSGAGCHTQASSARKTRGQRGGGAAPETAANTLLTHCAAAATAGQARKACVSPSNGGCPAAAHGGWGQHAASGGSTWMWHRKAPTYRLPCNSLNASACCVRGRSAARNRFHTPRTAWRSLAAASVRGAGTAAGSAASSGGGQAGAAGVAGSRCCCCCCCCSASCRCASRSCPPSRRRCPGRWHGSISTANSAVRRRELPWLSASLLP